MTVDKHLVKFIGDVVNHLNGNDMITNKTETKLDVSKKPDTKLETDNKKQNDEKKKMKDDPETDTYNPLIHFSKHLEPLNLDPAVTKDFLERFSKVNDYVQNDDSKKNMIASDYLIFKFKQFRKMNAVSTKSMSTLINLDNYWKKVCKHYSWEFIPSIAIPNEDEVEDI
jgi:hypothetical protein